MTDAKILLVEKNVDFGMVLKDYLSLLGYQVTYASDAVEALTVFKSNSFDLCVIDEDLVIRNNSLLLNKIRKVDNLIPIIFLTNGVVLHNAIRGFELGLVDNCLKQPFSSELLIQKIKLVLQLKDSDNQHQVKLETTIGNFSFNSKLRQLTFKNEKPRKLTPKESKLLSFLNEYKNDIMPKEIALTKIWDDYNYYTSRSMDVYITKLRKYLKFDENLSIVNVRGEGYKLIDYRY